MSEKVKLSKDGSSIDFVQSDSLPTSLKKFRQSPEIEGFYRFIFENDLQKEAFDILDRIVTARKAKKSAEKAAQKAKEKEASKAAKTAQVVKVAEKPLKAALPKVPTKALPSKAAVAPAKVQAKPQQKAKAPPSKKAASPKAKAPVKPAKKTKK